MNETEAINGGIYSADFANSVGKASMAKDDFLKLLTVGPI